MECIGFAWPGFGSQGFYRGGFSEKVPEASFMSSRENPCWLQDAHAIVKAGVIKDGGSTLLITYLKRRKRKLLCRYNCSQRRAE